MYFEKVLNNLRERVSEIYSEDYITKLSRINNPAELFIFDSNLTVDDLDGIRNVKVDQETFNVDDMTDDLKAGFLFIDIMYNEISVQRSNIEKRPDQIRGSKLMYASSYFKGNFAGEYPTGSGKSFMYLIFAAARYYIHGERSIITTSGISLQEQLDVKDAPFISKVFMNITDRTLNTVLIKGKNNYICNKRLSEAAEAVRMRIEYTRVKDLNKLQEYLSHIPDNFNGDVSNIKGEVNYEIQDALAVKDKNTNGCRICPLKEDCYHEKAKARARSAAIVIINYHVLLTEVEDIRQVGCLSGGAADNYIFDEAHEFSQIGRDFSEKSFGQDNIEWLIKKLKAVEGKITDTLDIKSPFYVGFSNIRGADLYSEIKELSEMFTSTMDQEYKNIKKTGTFQMAEIIVDEDTTLPLFHIKRQITGIKEVIDDFTITAIERCGFVTKEQFYAVASEDEEKYGTLLHAYELLGEICDTLNSYAYFLENFTTTERRDSNEIMWITKDEKTSAVSLVSKKIFVKEIGQIMFNNDQYSTVSVSATLSTGGNFDFYRQEIGINSDYFSYGIIGKSPFNLAEQELWYLPKVAKSGAKKETSDDIYYKAVSDTVKEVLEISHGGMLALFTSIKAMRETFKTISAAFAFQDINMYIQGQMPRKQLIDVFTRDMNSVLFATRSFFTGIDVRGASLRVLLIDKLPFENPSDPVSRMLVNRPNGFQKYAIPNMVMTLKQAIGRGVRGIDDRCLVILMDERITTANYRTIINKSFDENNCASRTRNIKDVEKFMSAIIQDNSKAILGSKDIYSKEEEIGNKNLDKMKNMI